MTTTQRLVHVHLVEPPSDPNHKTGAIDAFGYKQLLFAPIVGGRLFTAVSLPLIAEFGPIPVLIGVSVVMTGWLILGLSGVGRTQSRSEKDE